MAKQPLTTKERKRLKQINLEIGKLANEALDMVAASTDDVGFLYLSTLDFDGVDGSAMGGVSMIADMLATIGAEQSSLHGAILLAALQLSKQKSSSTIVPTGRHTKD